MTTNLGINLLKNRHTLSETEFKREQDLFRYSLIGFVVAVVLSLAMLGYQIFLSSRLGGIEDGIATSTAQLAEYTEANAQQIYLKSRLKLITSFLDARSVSRQAIQNMFSIEIPGVIVSGVSFESDNTLRAQFTADDVLALEQVLDYLEEENGFFVQTVSEGVVRTAEGSYQLQAMLTIPKE